MKSHSAEYLLDLVQRLSAEILRLEHLIFCLLDKFGNRLDIGILQAVVRTNRQFKLVNGLRRFGLDDASALPLSCRAASSGARS